jgi:septation ring formation regulator EzrA
MDEKKFQELVIAQFEKMDQRFEKMDQRFEKMDQRFDRIDNELTVIKNKQVEHDTRFDGLDKNLDIVARWTKRLVDNEDELADLYLKRHRRSLMGISGGKQENG